MHIEIEDFKTGWYQLYFGMTVEEIDQLIRLLELLRQDTSQHFHIFSDYTGAEGVGDIELYIKENSEVSNMVIGGLAIQPNNNRLLGLTESVVKHDTN